MPWSCKLNVSTGSRKLQFPGIPSFSPECFAYIRNPNPSLYKNYNKGLAQLLDEGAVQLLRERSDDGNGAPILAAVGTLQFDVVQYRCALTCNQHTLYNSLVA